VRPSAKDTKGYGYFLFSPRPSPIHRPEDAGHGPGRPLGFGSYGYPSLALASTFPQFGGASVKITRNVLKDRRKVPLHRSPQPKPENISPDDASTVPRGVPILRAPFGPPETPKEWRSTIFFPEEVW